MHRYIYFWKVLEVELVIYLFVHVLIMEYQKIIKFLACNIRREELKVGKLVSNLFSP